MRALIAKDPSLARSHHVYRKPLYFAVRENHVDVARFLLQHDSNPLDLWVDDDPIEIARDRGYVEMERMLADTVNDEWAAERLIDLGLDGIITDRVDLFAPVS